MDLHEQLKEIKTQLRLSMNGAVSQSMREKGLIYKLNFGVELPRIKAIAGEYEKNTGDVILERFAELDCRKMNAVLVHSHGPFVWGTSPKAAVLNSQVLEYISKMAYCNYTMSDGKLSRIQEELKNKHYNRKFGEDAYYGQGKK